MKTLILPVLAVAAIGFAMPAAAGGCSWGKQTTEKPEEKVENPSA